MPIEPQPNRAFEWTQASWGLVLQCPALEGIAHHFFTTSNLELRSDAREWNAVAEAMGVASGSVRLIRQVHGSTAAIANRGRVEPWNAPEADLIVSDDPAVAIAVRVADCAPILLADRHNPVVGAVHAGWRGTVSRAAQAGVETLRREFQSDPADLVAVVGPCLGPCCGEVGDEVVEAFRAAGHRPESVDRWFKPGPAGRPCLDLWRANRDQLVSAGVPADRIFVAELCTKTHAPFLHSYRVAKEKAGRMIGIVRAPAR
jgi:purine-nucleoside/S-methyl-5'-thioadenosine phosphorylase / adenosine deaminase